MKSVVIILAATATLAACASQQVVHSEYGSIDARSEQHVNDYEDCVGLYTETQVTSDEDLAEARAAREQRTLPFTALVSTIALGHAMESDEESVRHVDNCMSERGWLEW